MLLDRRNSARWRGPSGEEMRRAISEHFEEGSVELCSLSQSLLDQRRLGFDEMTCTALRTIVGETSRDRDCPAPSRRFGASARLGGWGRPLRPSLRVPRRVRERHILDHRIRLIELTILEPPYQRLTLPTRAEPRFPEEVRALHKDTGRDLVAECLGRQTQQLCGFARRQVFGNASRDSRSGGGSLTRSFSPEHARALHFATARARPHLDRMSPIPLDLRQSQLEYRPKARGRCQG